MTFLRFRTIGIFLTCLTLGACREETTTETVAPAPYDSAAAKRVDSAAPGIHSYSLEAGANDWILIPGEAAGHTHIGSDLVLLQKELGRPDAGDAAMQKSVSIWYADHDTTKHSVSVYASREPGNEERSLVRQIRITAPRFETVRGVRVGTLEADIRSNYDVKNVEQFRAKDGTMSKVLDSKDGIAFEVGADGICDAIIIHAAGAEQYGSYLKLR